ncbi:MAG: DUF2461 domain-containing protein [Salibacteraceae bacterium]
MIAAPYVAFFEGLEQNNHKAWFHANKATYEKEVKLPFTDLVASLISELTALEAAIAPNPKDALFRINRDVRFSKDKTPYNLLMKASFVPGGKKSKLPGFYLGIGAHRVHAGGGLMNLSGADLKRIRQAIADDTQGFVSIVSAAPFVHHFGELKGNRAKRIDKDLQPVLEKTKLIANKQFYAMRQFDLAPYLNSDQLNTVLMEHFKAIYPLNQFLKKALT